MEQIQAVVLAAGKSTRFNTGRTKLAEKIGGQEIILYVTKLFEHLEIKTTVVVGYQQDLIKDIIRSNVSSAITFVTQSEQLGSWHALECTHTVWEQDHILVMNGDMPLVTPEIITKLCETHLSSNADVTFAIAHHHEPSTSYGRIVYEDGVIRIVEAKEFTGDPQEDCCINAGIYLIKTDFLRSQVNQIERNGLSKEFYLTDLIYKAALDGKKVVTVTVPFDRVRGVNTLEELWASEQIIRSELIRHWMKQGVRFSGAQSSHIDLTVKIGAGTIIEGGVKLRGNTVIGQDAYIGEFVSVENSVIEDGVSIYAHCVINNSVIHREAQVGPFAHLRENSYVGARSIVGNFVEMKNSIIEQDSKAKHLTYLGDAHVGKHVNIGAGTITANHNGKHKQKTVVKDGAYIGCNTSLVAPVVVGKDSFTAAGSVITQDVPDESLAIARSRQMNKEHYFLKKKAKSARDEMSI